MNSAVAAKQVHVYLLYKTLSMPSHPSYTCTTWAWHGTGLYRMVMGAWPHLQHHLMHAVNITQVLQHWSPWKRCSTAMEAWQACTPWHPLATSASSGGPLSEQCSVLAVRFLVWQAYWREEGKEKGREG